MNDDRFDIITREMGRIVIAMVIGVILAMLCIVITEVVLR